jgi:ABC-type nitrate/sulfonate/bicarbonate transport system substrate-binding protein
MNPTRLLASVVVAFSMMLFSIFPLQPVDAQAGDTIQVRLFPAFNNLPIYLALDKGYFANEHLNVVVTKINTAPSGQIPSIARGDVDLAPIQVSPGFFNQFEQGFNVKLVSSLAGPKKGWNDSVYFMVREDLWDSGKVHSLADLKGKTVDVANEASTLDFIFRRALETYKLAPADFTITHKFRTPGDWFAAFQNKAADAMPIVEPIATQLQLRGLAHKLFSLIDVAPWYQDTFIAVSPDFERNHPDAVVRFLRAVKQGQRDVLRAGGKWTPEFVAEVAKWTELPPDVINQMIGPAYTGDLGRISIDSLTRQQDYYAELGVIPKKVPIAALIDAGPLRAASASP